MFTGSRGQKGSKHHLICISRAASFEVTVDFLLQQVTYLTERHASQVRAQMRKVTAAARSSAASSPVPGSESAAAMEAMRRTGSAQGLRSHTRAPSSLSIRKDSPMLRNDGSIPSTPKVSTPDSGGVGGSGTAAGRPQVSRASSSGTAVQVGSSGSATGSLRLKVKPPSPRAQPRHRLSSLPIVTSPTSATPTAEQAAPAAAADPSSPAADESPSPTSSASSSPAQSRIIRRPPRFNLQQQRDQEDTRLSYLGDADDEEAEPAFLPFKSSSGHGADDSDGSAHYTDPSATLRGDPRDFAANAARRLDNITGPSPGQGKGKGKERERILQRSQTSDSSASSAAFISKRSLGDRRPPSGPLSPRRTTELKGKGYSREGSDGTPSMGSSFSDLDGKIVLIQSICLVLSMLITCLQMRRSHNRLWRRPWPARCKAATQLAVRSVTSSEVDTCQSEAD